MKAREFFVYCDETPDEIIGKNVVLSDEYNRINARCAYLEEVLKGIEVIEHGSTENGTKEVWFLLRSDGNKIGAGSVRLAGPFADAMSLWAAKRSAALKKPE